MADFGPAKATNPDHNDDEIEAESPRSLSDDAKPVFVGDLVDTIGSGRFHTALTLVVGIACAAEAMEIFMLTFLRSQILTAFDVSDTQFAGLTTVVFLGMLVGSFSFGVFSDRVGRRPSCLLSMFLAALGGLATCLVPSFNALLACRFVVGLGVGGGHVPWSYLLEMIPTGDRERLVAWAQSSWTIGVLIQTPLAYLLRNSDWRFLVVCTALPLVVCFGVCWFLPESPRFLLSQRRNGEACKVFHRIIQANDPTLPPRVDDREQPIVSAIRQLAAGHEVEISRDSSPLPPPESCAPIGDFGGRSGPFSAVLHICLSPSLRRLNISLYLLWASVASAYYGVIMLTTSAMLQRNEYLTVFIASLGEIPAYPLLGWSTRRFGRQKPSQALPLAALLLLLTYTFWPIPEQSRNSPATSGGLGFMGVVLLLRLVLLLQFDIVFLYSPECYATPIRTTATGICSAAARVSSALAPFICYGFGTAPQASWLPAVIFSCILFIGFVAASFVPFETKGLDMDDDRRRTG